MDRKYVLTGLAYAMLGLFLGIYMAASKDHSQLVAHAHIMLVGFVVSFVYALIHKLWLKEISVKLSYIQYFTHQIGTVVLVIGLFLLYGNYVPDQLIGPILGISSIAVLVGLILMSVMYIKSSGNAMQSK